MNGLTRSPRPRRYGCLALSPARPVTVRTDFCQLARAGFFYRPALDDTDNVQCFHCTVKLDGWEPTDNPAVEHLAHSAACAWALSVSVSRRDGEEAESRDPLSDQLIDARRATFEAGTGWPHEDKRGWKCKTDNMVNAGWVCDPSPEADDGVTCFYCNLSLDGWEPKDDPFEEHKKRAEECPFFALVKQYHGVAAATKRRKPQSKGRSTSAARAGRMSTQSTVSIAASEAINVSDAGDEVADGDDSVMTTGTVSSQAPGKAKKGSTRPKAAAKGSRGRKKADSVASEFAGDVQYPDLSDAAPQLPPFEVSSPAAEQTSAKPNKGTRKAGRNSKQIDSSVMDISQLDTAPPQKPKRGKQSKTKSEPEPDMEHRPSDASAQLQVELDISLDYESPDDEATPQASAAKPKRGVKRTSDGTRKHEQDSSAVILEFPVPPKSDLQLQAQQAWKKASSAKVQQTGTDAPHSSTTAENSVDRDAHSPPSDVETSQPLKAKAPAGKKARGKKASSARSSKASAAMFSQPDRYPSEEDLAADEAEIERELERIAAEQHLAQQGSHQAVQAEQDNLDEFEASPTHSHTINPNDTNAVQQDGNTDSQSIKHQQIPPFAPSPPRQHDTADSSHGLTPSPSSSDKENQPSSLAQPSTKKPTSLAPPLSPTKSSRVPLAPSTPNHMPSKRPQLNATSPSKHQLHHLSSTAPWTEIDLDAALLSSSFSPSAHPTPGSLSRQLAVAAGALADRERGLSVEGWVRWRADTSEEELRRKCEEMVGLFEREGVRALGCLEGLRVVG